MEITSLDYHTAGEPLRIVTGGLPDIPGGTMLEKRRFMQANLEGYRRFLMLEPRGHADMYGAVLTPPVTADADVGVLFMHNEGYSTMCGHGIIAMVTAGLEHGLFEIKNQQAIQIDSPAGRISARAQRDSGGRIESVSFLNVPSFVLEEKYSVSVDGRNVDLIIAFGGAFYAYVDAQMFGFDLLPSEAVRLIEFGHKIKNEVNRNYTICHPDGDEELNFLYGTIFVRPGNKPGHSRNVCIFAEGELDRSPTGTGVSGRCAIHFARGEIGLGQELHIESIIGTAFTARCTRETLVGDLHAVIPEVTGSAHISGEHRFVLDSHDPLQEGFFIR
jgi:trans-L-3-hydroxyproline dehydratase